MFRWYIILGLCAATSHAANHTLFKTCDGAAGVCSRLRSNPAGNLFKIGDLTKYTLDAEKTAISWELSRDSAKFKLTIQLLEGAKVRLQLEETDKQRYKIKDVLDPDNPPKPIKIAPGAVKDGKQITITPDSSTDEHHTVIIHNDPLKVAFLDDGKELVVLDGTNLVMDYKTEKSTEIKDIGFVVQFNDAEKLYGLHHHAYALELPDTTVKAKDGKTFMSEPFRLRNSDTANFEANSPMALYGSVPVIYGHSKNSTAGIFLHNAAEQWVDIHYEDKGSPSAHFMVDSGSFDLFVMLGPNIEKVVKQFTDLTGKAHMPQLWTLGYHQSRWSYYTKEEVLEVVDQMKKKDFPLDAIWLDIDYTDDKKYFTWSSNFTGGKNGNGVKEMLKALGEYGKKLVTIIDPHIKKEDSYPVYKEGKDGKFFVQDKNGADFVGVCWPGNSSYVDFLNPDARKYYAKHYSDDEFNQGHPEVLAGIWNDMNEPSVFDEKHEWTMPFDLKHKSEGSVTFDVEHRDIHNIYGFLHTMSTHDGLMNRDDLKDPVKKARRPFILTRSHFAGSQRYAAMWTGDNTPDWPHLKNSYSECMLSNLVGHVFCGADIPGFFKDPVPTEEFVYRAYQAGIWFPFFRGHTSKDSENREPYRFNSTTQELIRRAMQMRYRHIPTWYQLFYEHTQTGAPVIRPLFYNFPGEIGFNDHIMLGNDILARPVFEEGAPKVEVHLPGEDEYWYRIDEQSVKAYQGGKDITIDVSKGESPVFYRGGSIIVTRDRNVTSTAEGEKYPLTVYVNLDKNLTASGKLYHDDGLTFAYEKKQILYAHLWFTEDKMLQVEPIGDQNHTGLTVVVEKVIVNDWKHSQTHVSTHHSTDEDGNSFSEVNVVQALRNDENKLLFKLRR